MAKIKTKTESSTEPMTEGKVKLIEFLKSQAPTLFDRHPVVTGNVEAFVDKIIQILS